MACAVLNYYREGFAVLNSQFSILNSQLSTLNSTKYHHTFLLHILGQKTKTYKKHQSQKIFSIQKKTFNSTHLFADK